MVSLEELRSVAADRTTERTLPVEENQRVFEDEIVPDELGHATSQTEPTVLFLIGQQGAGKTWLSRQLGQHRLDRHGDYVNVDSDRYKHYHPEYLRLIAESHRAKDPAAELGERRWSAANHTRADVNRWEHQIDAFVRGAHFVRDDRGRGGRRDTVHALLQCSGKDPQRIVHRLRLFRATHHRIEVVFLGVPKAVSWQGILYRYQVAVDRHGWGRLTGPVSREPSYQGVLELADLVQNWELADHVAVHRQGSAQPAWTNDDGRSPGRLRSAIERERLRTLTPDETTRFAARQEYLSERMDGEFRGELRRIGKLAQPLLPPGTRFDSADDAIALLPAGEPN